MLRTDLFKTVDRASTRFIAIRDTKTPADPEIGAKEIDRRHCNRGRLGIGYHFLILVCGAIVLCRDIETIGAHSKNYDDISVAVGIVGGTEDDGKTRSYTRNPEQIAALDDLVEVLSQRYADEAPEVHDIIET